MSGNSNKFRETQLKVETYFNGDVLVNDESFMNREMYKYNSQGQYIAEEPPAEIVKEAKKKPIRQPKKRKPEPDTAALEAANKKDLRNRNLK